MRPSTSDRLASLLLCARWASALVALMYHLRFLLLVNYEAVQDKSLVLTGFYFLSGLGHESYAVFFIAEGMLAGWILRRHGDAALPAAGQYLDPLYRIVLPGLLLGAALDVAGARYFGQTGVYTDFPEFSTSSLGAATFLGNALMLQPWLVPNFGSNSMLYLPAWLFWSFVLLLGVLCTPQRLLRTALVALLVLVLPYQFLIWAAIWLAGVGLVFLAEARRWRPPLMLAGALFLASLLGSRLLGPATGQLPEPLRDWLIQGGFAMVGLGFAMLAWSFYPRHATRLAAGLAWPAQVASFSFYFHFPVIMLLAAAGAALWELPLKQQPGAVAWAWLCCLAGASVACAAIVTWGSAQVWRWIASRRRPPVAGAQVRHVQVDQVQRRAPGDIGE